MKKKRPQNEDFMNRYQKEKKERKKKQVFYLCTGIGALLVVIFAFLMLRSPDPAGPGAHTLLKNARHLHNTEHKHAEALEYINKNIIPEFPESNPAVRKARDLKRKIREVNAKTRHAKKSFQINIQRKYNEQKEKNMPDRLTSLQELEEEIIHYIEDHKQFIQAHPEIEVPGGGGKLIYEAITNIRGDISQQKNSLYTDYYRQLEKNIFSMMMQNNLSEAYQKATSFREKFGGDFQPPADNLVKKVNTRLKALYQTVTKRADKLASGGQLARATETLEQVQSSFKNTPYEEKLKREIRRLKIRNGSAS